MNTKAENTKNHQPQFKLNLIEPYSTFQDGSPLAIPYVIDGLLTQGGFSVLGGKPKHGKSSLSRYEAVCVAKGKPFLDRQTTQGEVILISLEDPRNHVDNCLKALDYDPSTDAKIHIVEKLAPGINESIDAIGDVLAKMPNIRLVIVDTLAKLLRVNDMNDYSAVLSEVGKVHDLARNFSHLHIQGLAHCKKIRTDDIFDSLLGSTALRGEPDTSLALYSEGGHRIIATETRIGRNIPPTILNASLEPFAGANVLTGLTLAQPFSEWSSLQNQKKGKVRDRTYEDGIIEFLSQCEGNWAFQELTLAGVKGRRENKLAAIDRLKDVGLVRVTGEKQSPKNPLKLHLVSEQPQL